MRIGMGLAILFVLGASLVARAEAPTVPVSFVGEDIESATILVDGTRCRTPCTLPLTPGTHVVTVLDSRHYTRHVVVPDAPSFVRIKDDLRPQLISGIVLTTFGAVVGGSIWAPFAYACGRGNPVDGGIGCFYFMLMSEVAVSPVFFTGIGLLGYWAAHPSTTDLVAVPLTKETAPPLKLTSVGLQPVRDGLAAGVGFSF